MRWRGTSRQKQTGSFPIFIWLFKKSTAWLQDATDEEAFKENPEEAVVEVEEGGGEEPVPGGQHCR